MTPLDMFVEHNIQYNLLLRVDNLVGRVSEVGGGSLEVDRVFGVAGHSDRAAVANVR